MKYDLYYDSRGEGRIRGCRWMPEGEPKAIVQLVHGIAEHIDRYEPYAKYLNAMGFAVVAEDHMGHGRSIGEDGVKGYFHGGWFTAVEDTCQLMRYTMKKFPGVPYILLGISMGSFMVRTILAKYPASGIAGAIICGTCWQPKALLTAVKPVCELVCRTLGETQPNHHLHAMMFGSYNQRIVNPRTPSDWMSRDQHVVDAYEADPLCGFVASAGLVRDMMEGIAYIQKKSSIMAMSKELPVFFIAGTEDPVGDYGKGVEHCAKAFRSAGMERVAVKLYPDCRHDILNELDKLTVWADTANWIEMII